jgi:hypothetical protein
MQLLYLYFNVTSRHAIEWQKAASYFDRLHIPYYSCVSTQIPNYNKILICNNNTSQTNPHNVYYSFSLYICFLFVMSPSCLVTILLFLIWYLDVCVWKAVRIMLCHEHIYLYITQNQKKKSNSLWICTNKSDFVSETIFRIPACCCIQTYI